MRNLLGVASGLIWVVLRGGRLENECGVNVIRGKESEVIGTNLIGIISTRSYRFEVLDGSGGIGRIIIQNFDGIG